MDPCKGGGIRADVKHPKYYTLAGRILPYGSRQTKKCRRPGNEARHAATLVHSTLVLYYGRYLGLGRRYEAGICTIVISISGPFQ